MRHGGPPAERTACRGQPRSVQWQLAPLHTAEARRLCDATGRSGSHSCRHRQSAGTGARGVPLVSWALLLFPPLASRPLPCLPAVSLVGVLPLVRFSLPVPGERTGRWAGAKRTGSEDFRTTYFPPSPGSQPFLRIQPSSLASLPLLPCHSAPTPRSSSPVTLPSRPPRLVSSPPPLSTPALFPLTPLPSLPSSFPHSRASFSLAQIGSISLPPWPPPPPPLVGLLHQWVAWQCCTPHGCRNA